ncbi:MAG: NIPSNAP family protein [Gammaproteobacteria bacterium]
MIAHLRIYTINKGMMEDWQKLFRDELVGLMAEAGIKVESAWTNAEATQFIWIRSYGDSTEDIATKEKAFYESPWWVENVDYVRSHIAHREITVIQSI